MAKKTIAELLQETKALKQKEIAIKNDMKNAKKAIALEYADGLPEAEKQKQITEAEAILNNAKVNALKAKDLFKFTMRGIKEDVAMAKEILSFVNWKQKNSLPKQKNSFVIKGNTLTFNREGIQQIVIDTSKANWEKTFKEELKKQGINGENRIADNIIYKAQTLLKSNVTI
jgi:hypothetical protein